MAEIRCPKCGKIFPSSGDAPRFCSACGAALQTERDDKRALLNAADRETDARLRREKLLAAREAWPDDYEIERRILYIGRLYERGGKPDFYRIPFWPLQAVEKPREFSAKERRRMMEAFFENPELARVCALAPDEETFWRDYFDEMAAQYVELFIKCASTNSLFLGFKRRPNDVMKRSAACAADMLRNIEGGDLVPEAHRQTLEASLWRGFQRVFPDAGDALARACGGRVKFRPEA